MHEHATLLTWSAGQRVDLLPAEVEGGNLVNTITFGQEDFDVV